MVFRVHLEALEFLSTRFAKKHAVPGPADAPSARSPRTSAPEAKTNGSPPNHALDGMEKKLCQKLNEKLEVYGRWLVYLDDFNNVLRWLQHHFSLFWTPWTRLGGVPCWASNRTSSVNKRTG